MSTTSAGTGFETTMVTSRDGTVIATDSIGSGPPLILVGGAFSYRRWKGFVDLARRLSDTFTVFGYDRRGRGESGNGPSDAATDLVAREVNDLAAVARLAGRDPLIFGMSSGGVLALRAVAAGVPARGVVVYQPPFVVTDSGTVPPADFGSHLDGLIAEGRRSAAVHYFMTRGMGAPVPIVAFMRLAPFWKDLKAVAHTLPADVAVMGGTVQGMPLDLDPWNRVEVPVLVLDGGRSPKGTALAASQLVSRLPAAERVTLTGQGHNVSMAALEDAIRGFGAGRTPDS
ncbi:alpha/beta fold hydrolase [Parafrankia sp. EUN1f]|uniref:alpha/beta fold hydrolase n=1 Tax=Parafrankia sp. EUN1f TaxID=102897 RepID=UPI0001C44283|nr:alpha/beta hydrolase [Parafrankia sp. EUN1f]EFC85362.1 hydrolase [Parafrankia sp. EUN1f]